MPLNNGKPIIGRLARAGLGFLLSVAGWPVAVSWFAQADHIAADAAAAFADLYAGISGLGQPGPVGALRMGGSRAKERSQKDDESSESGSHGESPKVERLHSSLAG